MSGVRVRPAGPGDGPAVAAVLAAAFPDILAVVFGRHLDGGLRFLASEHARGRGLAPVYLAEAGCDVIGAVELRLGAKKKVRRFAVFRSLLREGGWPWAVRAAFGFSLLVAQTADPDCAYVGFLGVVPSHRRRGVGRRLLRHAAREARLAGKRRLVLDVAAGNREAIGLYRGLGFRRVKAYRSLLTRWFFGVGEWEVWGLALGRDRPPEGWEPRAGEREAGVKNV